MDVPPVLPWIIKKFTSRPKKVRKKGANKARNPYKENRANGYMVCGNCK